MQRNIGKEKSGLFECSINGNIFKSWIKQVLLPELPENRILIMDNAAFHKRKSTKELTEAVEYEILWLSAYSPDLNPIEKMGAKLKYIRWLFKTECFDLVQALYEK